MVRDGRSGRPRKGPRRDWTYKLESYKVFLYVAQVILFILLIVRRIVDDMAEIEEYYFNLLDVMVPISLMVVLIGAQEVVFSTLVGAFRKDLADRYRFLESAKRGAVSTAVVSFIIFFILVAPPVHDMIKDAGGGTETHTDEVLYETFKTKDPLNLTSLSRIHLTNEDNVVFNVTLHRGDTEEDPVEAFASRVREWEHDFRADDTDDFLVRAEAVAAPGDITWKLKREAQVREELVAGVAFPFLVLGILNALFYPLARLWSSTTEEAYVETQTRKLRARFKVEEAFLIYDDGRLIAHNSRRLKPERDKDIMTGMLTAVQSFVTDTLIDEERGTLDQLKYGNLSILVEGKGRVNLACIISGEDSPVLRDGMRNIVSYIGTQYHTYLRDWDGDVDRFKDVKRYIGHLVSTGREEPVWPDELFLLHRDGRLVSHQTSRLEPSIDDGLLQNWVDQIVGAVKRSMADPGQQMPSQLNVMGYDVLLEFTNYLYIAFMTTRKDAEDRREVMTDVLHDIDGRFHNVLYDWDGATSELTDVKMMMEVILDGGSKGR